MEKFQSLVSSMQGLVGAIECATVPLDILVPPVMEDITEVVQVSPRERVRARIAEQRVHIPVPPIKASPFVLARDEPAENPEESRLQGRGLVNGPTQVTMKLRCRRATHACRSRPPGKRGLH